eukprot:11190887-Lingulodinium_polyedra.AAC.1
MESHDTGVLDEVSTKSGDAMRCGFHLESGFLYRVVRHLETLLLDWHAQEDVGLSGVTINMSAKQ